MNIPTPIAEPPSINNINVDSYDYYQNLNLEAKSENFLDLYLIEDKNFLFRSVEVSNIGVDITDPNKIITYTVKSGDSLGKIATQFDINVETIRTANSLKKNTITPGQELVILPISGIYYTVKKGDTLNALAIKYKISASVIREYNNLEADALNIGEKIILPGAKEKVIVANPTNISSATKITENSTSSNDFFMYPTVG
ncbi:MAG: LysM peptidoglycan-binding domain-containing protein [Candidatus Paceibacterota bacterium]|jgi:LysM repeat protein